MSAFATVAAKIRKPPAIEKVPPTAFAEIWAKRPTTDVVCGIRPLSENDIVFAKAEAARAAWALYPQPDDDVLRYDAFTDAQMRFAVSRGTCDPNDVTLPWECLGGKLSDELVRQRLTSEGTKLLFDAIERVTISTSPVRPQADDDDIIELCQLAPTVLQAMPTWQAARVRRLLLFCLDEIREAAKPT